MKKLLSRLPGPVGDHPLLFAGGLAVVLLLLVYVAIPSGTDQPKTAFFEVRRGSFTVSIVEGGTLEAVSEEVIRNEVEGTSRIIYIVPEGTYVQEGDRLVELDASNAQEQYDQQQIAVEKADFSLVQSEKQLEIDKSIVDSDTRAAKLKVRFAKIELEKFEKGQSQVDLMQMQDKVLTAEAQLEVDKQTFDYTKKLADKGYEIQTRVDSDRLKVMGGQNQLMIATNNVWMLTAFDLPKMRAQYESDLEEAEKDLERVIQQGENRLAQSTADMMTQSNTLVLNNKKLGRYQKNLDGTIIDAPQEGLVVYPIGNSRFSSESMIEEGATVRNRQELIKLPDTSRMKVNIKVHESQINLVRAGQLTFVVLDSMPDKRFRGVVNKVALLPDTGSRWGNPNLKVYKTEILVTDPLPDIKPGVSASTEIVVTNIENAISVPIQAVTTLKGQQVVYARQGRKTVPKPVEVGLFNTKFIEVVSGLEKADRVLLSPPFDTEEQDLAGSLLAQSEKVELPTTAPASRQPPGAGPARGPASEGRPEGAGRGAEAGDRPAGGGLDVQAMIKRFDKNGNGRIDASEREAARAAMPGGLAGGPGGGGGREAMMKQFDKDGDGELSDEERQAMRAEMGRRFGGGQGGRGAQGGAQGGGQGGGRGGAGGGRGGPGGGRSQ